MFKIFSSPNSKDKANKSPKSISKLITKAFTHRKIDDDTLEDLENILLSSDIGFETTDYIINALKKEKFSKEANIEEIKKFLANYLIEILKPCEKKLDFETNNKPKIIIFNGVNGSGKTTTIGKIASILSSSKKKVIIAACDTFRAAASQQLEEWAQKSNCQIVSSKKEGQDPASVAYEALDLAKKEQADFLLVDTAGRLQNKQNLMDELAKISKVLKKIINDEAAYNNILVLDGTVGQNALSQFKAFDDITSINGIIITKLDGTAKGGILVALAKKFKKPIYAVGRGEKIDDLQEFIAEDFVNELIGVN